MVVPEQLLDDVEGQTVQLLGICEVPANSTKLAEVAETAGDQVVAVAQDLRHVLDCVLHEAFGLLHAPHQSVHTCQVHFAELHAQVQLNSALSAEQLEDGLAQVQRLLVVLYGLQVRPARFCVARHAKEALGDVSVLFHAIAPSEDSKREVVVLPGTQWVPHLCLHICQCHRTQCYGGMLGAELQPPHLQGVREVCCCFRKLP